MKVAIMLLALTSTVGAQALPDAPKPHTKLDTTLTILDFGARTADLISTRNFMANRCQCIYEIDPIAPHTRALGPQLAFTYGMFAVVTGGAYMLRKHGHRKIARALVLADIADETYADINNIRLNNAQYVLNNVPIK
jgi:hypothetical protein